MKLGKRIGWLMLVCSLLIARTDFAPAQAPPRQAQNAALRYWMAFALMQDPHADKATTDLLESAAAGKASWDEARLGPILDVNREAIQTMQRGTELPDCDWGLD